MCFSVDVNADPAVLLCCGLSVLAAASILVVASVAEAAAGAGGAIDLIRSVMLSCSFFCMSKMIC